MAKPKPMIEKNTVSIKLSAELKRDIQTMASIFDRPFTVYIEEEMQKHVNANRAMIEEEREMKEELRKKYAAGQTFSDSSVTNSNLNSVIEKYVVKNKERIEVIEEKSTLSKEKIGAYLPKRAYFALRIPELKKAIKENGINYEEIKNGKEKKVDLLSSTAYFCVYWKDLSAETQAAFADFNTQIAIALS